MAALLVTIGFTSSAQAPVRKVLIEEFTTASCGNCPPMSAYITAWQEAHAANCIVYTIHEGSGTDAMSNNTTKTIFNAMHPGWGWFAPAAMIDRGVYPWVDTLPYLNCYKSWGSAAGAGMDSIATRLMGEAAKVGVGITGTYNAATRTIDATVNVQFTEAVSSGDWRINLFLIEDSVIGYPGLGAFVGWDQHCYDATWANSHYPGKFDGTSIIGYPHRHVMRKSMLGDWGKQGTIPTMPAVGVNYHETASLVVDTAYKPGHLSLVAFVASYGTAKNQKTILNANDVLVSAAFTTGTAEQGLLTDKPATRIEGIYPTPASGLTRIVYQLDRNVKSEISIQNIYGQTMEVFNANTAREGVNELSFDASNFAKGIYFISLKTEGGVLLKKFIIE